MLDDKPGRLRAIRGRLSLFTACVLLASTGVPRPALAQVAFSVAAESDFRLRGSSLSGNRPVLTAQASYDDPSGLYANLSATGVHRSDGVDLLNLLGNVGYAKRLSSAVSIDAGLVHSRYRWGNQPNPSSRRTEAYVGVTVKDVGARLSYSPHYFEEGISMLYGEVEAGFQPAPDWRLSAHAGLLTLLEVPGASGGATRRDWRVGISRQWGAFEIHSALSGGGPDLGTHGATVITVGASINF